MSKHRRTKSNFVNFVTSRQRNRIGEQEIGAVAGGEEGADEGVVDGEKEDKNKLKTKEI